MTARQLMALAALGSGLLLLGAFAFQYSGYPPCQLCILQRWPHVIAIAIALAVLFTRRSLPAATRFWGWAGAAVMLACAVLAFYHTGVEMKWWPGPNHCSGGASQIVGLSVDELMAQINAAPVVRCDEPALLILGLSMAAWNAIGSLVLAGVWLVAARRAR